MNTEEVLTKILSKKTDVSKIDLDQPISSLGIDSLDLVETLIEIEDELGITFESDEMMEIKTLRQVKDLIDSKLKNK